MQHHDNPWLAFIGICLVSFLGCIDFTIVDTALPSIQAELDVTVTQLQWIINIFLLALAALMVILGKLADVYGHRKVLYLGMIGFAVFSLGAGLSPNIHWLILFRFLQGITVAITYTVPVAIIPNLFPKQHINKAMGILVGINGFGLAIGPVVGGFILGALSWRWIFLINPIIIIVAFIFCLKHLSKSKTSQDKQVDWLGAIMLVIALPILILATVNANQWGWGSGLTLSLYAISIGIIALFYWHENNIKYPIIEFHLFSNRTFFSGSCAQMLLAFFYSLAFFLMPLYLHNIHDLTGFSIGFALLPASMMVAILSPVVSHLVNRYSAKPILLIGFAMLAISAWMQTFFNVTSSLLFIEIAFLIFGIGWAYILSPSLMAVLGSIPNESSGVATGTLFSIHNFGGALGLAIGTVVYHHFSYANLLTNLKQHHVTIGNWLDDAIADPDNAAHIIQTNTHLVATKAESLFQQFFIQGYSGSMILLTSISILGFIIVAFGLKTQRK